MRWLAVVAALCALSACTAEPKWADDSAVTQARYIHDGPTSLTLITAINNRSGNGGHSALLVNGSERVLWDPAGTWWHPTVPERNDVLFGMNPTVYDFYLDYHARETFHVVLQEVEVSPEVADQALALVKANGAAGNATCAITTSRILQALGLPQMSPSYFPVQVMEDFAKLPGVSERKIFDDSPDSNSDVLRYRAQQAAKAAAAG
ncbi:hypothetical protein [Thalassobacter stenotrophicus]|uniref:Lipoprotein n=2 Tax=Thalassobacter stenotrophicus TaxID=266809 RepID=A0A0P1EVF6_9RHOB|nr:hypothetical protein [Thalassobacter stenotrophicus]PVZ49972.1 hypothetical protein DD557_15245 [Thalassobacter stenotrophicus]CUH58899.1 hypothetical protein THS5294_00179 [Thalassobacter stenotrophicus]SHJ26448.1 hypothetical protein SAMN02744035_03130 [Thalassobacter stenotrophicus DSM 16310]